MFIDAAPTHETYKSSEKKILNSFLLFAGTTRRAGKNWAKYYQSYSTNTEQESERGHPRKHGQDANSIAVEWSSTRKMTFRYSNH